MRAGPANSRRNAGAICSTQGPRTPADFGVPYDPRRARQTQQISGTLCCTQDPPDSTKIRVSMVHAGPAKPTRFRGHYVARRARQIPKKKSASMVHAGPAKPNRFRGHYVARRTRRIPLKSGCSMLRPQFREKTLKFIMLESGGLCMQSKKIALNCIDTPPTTPEAWLPRNLGLATRI